MREGLDCGLRVGLKPLLVNQSSCRWLGESGLSAGLSACQTSDGEPPRRPLVGVVGRGRGLRRRAVVRSLNSPSAVSRDLAFALLRCWGMFRSELRSTGAPAWPTGVPKTVRPGCTRARAGELARRRGMFPPRLALRAQHAALLHCSATISTTAHDHTDAACPNRLNHLNVTRQVQECARTACPSVSTSLSTSLWW